MIKKQSILVLLSILLFTSCTNEEATIIPESNSDNTVHVCSAIQSPEGLLKAASLTACKWPNGSVIKVKFLNGNAFLQSKVKQFAPEWSNYANITFDFVASNVNADIKINFDDSGITISSFGTGCQTIAQNKSSMNFGWFTDNSLDKDFRGIILHEFGHALGLIHEHQNPLNGISWNKPVVYDYFLKNHNWSKEKVDNNLFTQYNSTQSNYTQFDPNSIMIYKIEPSWTTNGFSVSAKEVLSATDKRYISELYPYPNRVVYYRYNVGGTHIYLSDYNVYKELYSEGVMGMIFKTQEAGTVPIYRYLNTQSKRGLSTINFNELGAGGISGWVSMGISGYAYQTKVGNSIPVHRYYNGSDHFLTTNYDELGGGKYGYNYFGIAFYILP